MKIFSIINYVCLILGLSLLGLSFYLYQSKQAFIANAETAQGTVVELIASRSDKSTTYRPVITFTTKEGKQTEFTSSAGSNPPSYNQGEKVTVLYDPKNPVKADINSFSSLWLGAIIVGFIGFVFFLIGVFSVVSDKKKQKKLQYLLANGKRISTKFEAVEINNSTAVNGRNPYQICTKWFDEAANELYVFKSNDIWFDPTDYIGTEPIKVIIDPNDRKNYNMDISFLPKLKK